MRVYLFYRSHTENEPVIRDFMHDLKGRGENDIQLMDLNTRDGSSLASLYDVMQTPSLLVTSDDGQVVNLSQGTLPLANDVSYYTHQ
ncbi:hypothetical protein KC878_00940 [Candidatus Saccharibacteria bacterium]|nr:hypothetical protein [Candidatus Saccharibacteria bacterium]MCB9821302.1 hypothetical protein [Candidatus Nomurabacteria bacterium]